MGFVIFVAQNMKALNIDILLVIAIFCDQSTLCMLTGTCKTLYRTAARYALSERAVSLDSDRAVELFLRFMRPQNGERWKLLQTLTIQTKLLGRPDIAKALASSIRQATNLEDLELVPAEVILGSHPDLGPAFASLPKVKYVGIAGANGLTCRMFEEMRWPLETAIIERTSIDTSWEESDWDDNEAIHPVELCKNACDTLKSLDLDRWLVWDFRSPSVPVYPKLDSLTVTGCYCPPTAPWATAFPNLSYLEVSTIEHACSDFSEENLEAHLDTQEENREEHLSRGTWNELAMFKGAALDLYLVGIPCPIRHLELGISRKELRFLAAALSDARPTTLDLDISTTMFTGGDNSWLLKHLRNPSLSTVRVLILRIWLHMPSTADIPDFLTCLGGALPSLRLESLSLHIRLENYSAGLYLTECSSDEDSAGDRTKRPARARSPTTPPCATEVYMSTLDVYALAHRFRQASESLQNVNVNVEFWRSSDYEDKHIRMTRSDICASASNCASF
ncbi:uncharacterized protein TRAVEDRAFT_74924 [Trametes versicolor FP-101664 SS1]|uniref:uncharacterized protein n=1 Tax=Trametes versicolor (strain FP-101664) TaxID=717944 RepID=UPI00046235DE|nr:uncharacterized protein TRAVEDRAFT_74924 [Trametes versicolor FP-101664 SS1]EIW52508.1 hypothetical protein TRAVEDRAFT_74924 [Trametes versicolor FP-101664 SS1]